MIDINITFFIQCINFLVSLFLINILIVRPIRGVLARRREELEESRTQIIAMQKEIDELMQQYSSGLSSAEEEGIKNRKSTLEEAKQNAVKELEKTRMELLSKTSSLEEALAKQAVTVSEEIAHSLSLFSDNIRKRLVQ